MLQISCILTDAVICNENATHRLSRYRRHGLKIYMIIVIIQYVNRITQSVCEEGRCIWHATCNKEGKEQHGTGWRLRRYSKRIQAGRMNMKTQLAAIKSRNAGRTESRVDEQIMKVGFSVIGLSSLAIGIWAMASLVGGMVASGGPLALVTNWIGAVIG